MLTDHEVELLLSELKIPIEGKALIREMRSRGPVLDVTDSMDSVRTRLISRKMNGRALYAANRTIAYPCIYGHEFNVHTAELWPYPCTTDMVDSSKKTRLQYVPTVFTIQPDQEHVFVIEEWRSEKSLLNSATKRPELYHKDAEGNWHFSLAEEIYSKLGLKHCLHSEEEIPRKYIANLHFLEDYTLESCPVVPDKERRRLEILLKEHLRIPMMDLLEEHHFDAGHVNQLILDRSVYVDLYKVVLSKTFDLIIYRDQLVSDTDRLLAVEQNQILLPEHVLQLAPGSKFTYDGKTHEILLVGVSHIHARDEQGNITELPLTLLRQLHERAMVQSEGPQVLTPEYDVDEFIEAKGLVGAMKRMEYLNNPDMPGRSARTHRRYKAKTRGLRTPQEQISALTADYPGNTKPKLPAAAIRLAEEVIKEHHNTAPKPTKASSLDRYRVRCMGEGVEPMGKTSFYNWIKGKEDVRKREGKRKAYQKAAIPLIHDYEHPVHGVRPHEVCYVDHTILNQMLKGQDIANLGKPTLTLATDGSLSMARAFVLMYRPAGTESVLMVLRDYVRRHGRLPKTIVLDNAKEFRSAELKQFCAVYGIFIRYRRASKSRDSTLVERAIGATEVEVLQQLEGNSICLKNPREVSASHKPEKHIRWSLAPLYGALEHYFFTVKAGCIHPRFGMSPLEKEKRLNFEMGDRSHLMVPYDSLFRLMTAPYPEHQPTRCLDRQRGIYVDGVYYWHNKLAAGKRRGESCEVRREPWRRRVVYVQFRNQWLIAQARDGGRLEGVFSRQVEIEKREESRRRQTDAQRDRNSTRHAIERAMTWDITNWDLVERAKMVEEYLLYSARGMCEAMEDAKNPHGDQVRLQLPKVTSLDYVMEEPDVQPDPEEGARRPTSNDKAPVARMTVSTAPAEEVVEVDEEDVFF